MTDIILDSINTKTLLKEFSNRLWNKLKLETRLEKRQYDLFVDEILQINKKEEKKINKSRIPIPFYGFINDECCYGIKKNHGLYTQCTKKRLDDKDYCVICQRHANNNVNDKPKCGDIRDRKKTWSNNLDYKPPGMTKEIPYANIIKKLNIDINVAQDIVRKLGWDVIPKCHLVKKKSRRGRPKTKVVVEDSDDEEPKKRGRPKKVIKKELTDDELILLFMSQAE